MKHTVKCNCCEWTGTEEDLIPMEDKNAEKDGLEPYMDACPNCKTDHYLMDI